MSTWPVKLRYVQDVAQEISGDEGQHDLNEELGAGAHTQAATRSANAFPVIGSAQDGEGDHHS
ncbi:hypothetical protein SDC9_114042 [bioreactor metagenome]|uniref:Uncharacterized protein n=1 Tax=bioreactor metagenome TaxID=1076179 RepID=A0A645BPB2_9ZZZZ